MSIEFTLAPGMGDPASGNNGTFFFDPTTTGEQLACAEKAGFGSVIVDDAGGILANFDIATFAARLCQPLRIVLTHWAGVIAPVVATRQLMAPDTDIGGRLVLRVPADAYSDAGDGTGANRGHIATMEQTDEYLMLLKRLWSNERPFDFEGAFYSVRHGFLAKKRLRAGAIPIRMGGSSGTAVKVAARHADVFELSPGPLMEVRRQMERVRNAAAQFGRSAKVSFALPVIFRDGVLKMASPYPVREPAYKEPADAATSFLRYVEAGVSEFMVSGIYNADAMRLFGEHVVSLIRNDVEWKQAVKPVNSLWGSDWHRAAPRHRSSFTQGPS